MLNGRRQSLLGIGFVVLLAAVVYLGWQRPSLFGGDDAETVRAVFDSAHGVSRVGNDVRLAGARVGRIDDVQRRGDDAVVVMRVERAAAERLRADASAELRPRFAFEGTAFIDLHTGSASAPPLAGRTIERARTRVYQPLDQALKFLRPDTRRAAQRTVRESAAALEGAALQGVLRKAPALSEELAVGMRAARGPRGDELAGTVAGAARTLDALAAQERSLRGFLRGTEGTMAAFDADRGAAVAATLRTAPGAMASLRRGSDALVGVLDQLDPLAGDLRPGLRALDPALREARPLLRRAPAALAATTRVVARLRAAVNTGARVTPVTQQLLRTLRTSAASLRASLLPALNADTPELGIPTYRAVLNLLEGGAGAFAPFQTLAQSYGPGQVGAGHFVRFDGHFYSGMGVPAPPCSLVERANAQLAGQLAAAGVCKR